MRPGPWLRWPALVVVSLGWIGCQPAGRYPPAPSRPTGDEERPSFVPPSLGWQDPGKPVRDIPLQFVASSSPEWEQLPAFWNPSPAPGAAQMALLGLPPLNAAATLVATDGLEVVKIKVPLGLPDPSGNVPAANPLTLGKWRLGRSIFHEKLIEFSGDALACASCHNPEKGFSNDWPAWPQLDRNTPSLINVVYNRSQFWDGRVTHLEEVIVRTLQDEEPTVRAPKDPRAAHVWGGLVRRLGERGGKDGKDYRQAFRRVFGTPPTQDAVAKALATYLRTILSGNSVYDRAESVRRAKKAEALTAEHFEAVLNDAALKSLDGGSQADEVARDLETGHRLFHGKAGCAACHPAPLFTDHGFHNTGILKEETEIFPSPGEEPGRFAHLPPGLKEARLVGAFRTPALRALPRTGPYMHDGRFKGLDQVVDYYAKGLDARFNAYLDPLLREGPGRALRLNLSAGEKRALVLFLRSLGGGPVDPLVTAPAAKK